MGTKIFARPRPDLQEPDRQDTPETAEARVTLKLAAEGYSAARFGADAGGLILAAATFTLQARALAYYGRLTQKRLADELPEDLGHLHEDLLVARRFADLQVASLAYSGTRTGADACNEYTRAAIGALCAAAVAYVESLLRLHEGNHRKPSRGLPRGDEP